MYVSASVLLVVWGFVRTRSAVCTVCTRYLSGGTCHLCMISRFSIPLESYKENSALWTLSAKRKEQLPCYYGPVTNVSRM